MQDQDSAQLAPVMFLYMQHPHTSLATSSHSLFCAMVKQSAKVQSHVLTRFVSGASLRRLWKPCISNAQTGISMAYLALYNCMSCMSSGDQAGCLRLDEAVL